VATDVAVSIVVFGSIRLRRLSHDAADAGRGHSTHARMNSDDTAAIDLLVIGGLLCVGVGELSHDGTNSTGESPVANAEQSTLASTPSSIT
jgi:hypothetical protein